MVFIFLRVEVFIQLLSQFSVVVTAICQVWQTFLQARDFFAAMPRLSCSYWIISWVKWLRVQGSRCCNNLQWSCWTGGCSFCVRHVCRSIDSRVAVFFLLASLAGLQTFLARFSLFLFYYWCFVERVFLVASVITAGCSLNKRFNKQQLC